MVQIKRFAVNLLLFLGLVHNPVKAMWININCDYVKTLNVVDKKIKEDFRYLTVDIEYPQILNLSNESAEKVINNQILNYTTMWIKDVENIAKEYFGESLDIIPTYPYQLISRYYVKRNSDVLSFYIDYYQYTGGAHGITNRVTYNIDCNSGEQLSLKDLFNRGYDFKAFINNEIRKQINKSPEIYFQGSDGFNGIKENQQYFLEEDNLVIQFQHYDIAPYSTGMPQFKIPLTEINANFIYSIGKNKTP